MANRKVKIAIFGTIGKSIAVETGATYGATLGTNVFTPDGVVGTPNTVRAWLGLTPLPPAGVEDDTSTGVIHHRLLQGLTLGDDHPQYTQWIQDEVITGAWTFENIVTIANPNGGVFPYDPSQTQYQSLLIENVDYPNAGIELLTVSGDDPLNDGIGNQLSFWEVGVGGAFTDRSYGFRIRHTGDIDAEGNLDFYRHQNDVSGVLFMRFTRDSSQVQFAPGSASAPILTTFGDLNTGIYFPGSDQVGFTAGSQTVVLVGGPGTLVSSAVVQGPNGSNTVPTFSFSNDTNTGMYRGSNANELNFTTDGTARLTIPSTEHASSGGIQGTLSFRGPAGSTTIPSFTFIADSNTGFYNPSADVIGVVAGGTLRASWTTAALVLTYPISAANGSAAAPSYAFTNDLAIGMFRGGTNVLQFATAGTLRFSIDAGGAFGLGGAPDYGTAGQVLASNGPGAPPSWSGAGAGVVISIIPGDGIIVDDYDDPTNPIVSVDQAFDFTWTGDHVFTGTLNLEAAGPRLLQIETDQAANAQRWVSRPNAGTYQIGATLDDNTAFRSAFAATRNAASSAIELIEIGNGTNDPDLNLLITELQIQGSAGTSGQLLESQGAGVAPQWVDPPAGGAGVTVDVYTADDTWTKPAGTAWVEIICIGQGGGGGGGSKRAVSTTRAGGGGGGGGGYSRAVVRASDLAATVAVECNGGGTGGPGATVDSNNGTPGTDGEPSAFGTAIRATGGAGGAAGAGTTNAGGAAGAGNVSNGGAGGTGGTTTTNTAGADSAYAGPGGGGGGGVSSANNQGDGEPGGSVTLTNPALAGGTGGAINGGAGNPGGSTGDAPVPGSGGGGGGGEDTGGSSGGAGADGGDYGAGGGGGAGATNGAGAGGDGGDGADGIVIVVSYPL